MDPASTTYATAKHAEAGGMTRLVAQLRRLRPEEFLFLLLFIPSMIVTVWANVDLAQSGISSRKIEGGIVRLVVVVAVAGTIPLLAKARMRVRSRWLLGTVDFLRTFLPFALCSAVYTNLHDTVRYVNPHDIHDKLVALEGWIFGFQPVVWAQQFITPERTEFFSFLYANFFLITISVSLLLWFVGRRQDARETMLGIILCFYTGYVFYLVYPAAPPRLYLESLGMFSIDLRGGPITDFQNALISLMPNHASRAAFPSLHTGVSVVCLYYAWRFCRWFSPILLLFVLGLLASTIYLRHHYVVDLLAGAVLVPWVVWLTPRFDRWWRGSDRLYDLGEGGRPDSSVSIDKGGPRR